MQDYNEHEHLTKHDRGRIQGVVARERAMVLGAVLHHGGVACQDGGLGGSDKAVTLTRNASRSYDLLAWKHLKNPQGQFGAAYKGSLINLGVFKTDDEEVSEDVEAETNELDETTQSIEIRELSALGLRLAEAYRKSVQRTSYVSLGLTLKGKVAADVLSEFGAKPMHERRRLAGRMTTRAFAPSSDQGDVDDAEIQIGPEIDFSNGR
jgi:hypothetical protein